MFTHCVWRLKVTRQQVNQINNRFKRQFNLFAIVSDRKVMYTKGIPRSSFIMSLRMVSFSYRKPASQATSSIAALFEDKIKNDCTAMYKLSKGFLKPGAIKCGSLKTSINNLKSFTFHRCPTPCCQHTSCQVLIKSLFPCLRAAILVRSTKIKLTPNWTNLKALVRILPISRYQSHYQFIMLSCI